MKAALIALIVSSILSPYTQYGDGAALQTGEIAEYPILGFKKGSVVVAEVRGETVFVGAGNRRLHGDIDCYFMDKLGHVVSRDESNNDGCKLSAIKDDRLYLIVANHGYVLDKYTYTITGE